MTLTSDYIKRLSLYFTFIRADSEKKGFLNNSSTYSVYVFVKIENLIM